MSTDKNDPTDAIARALFQLRGQRLRRGDTIRAQFGGHPHSRSEHERDHHDHHADHPADHQGSGESHAHGQHGFSPRGRGMGRRSGEMAWMRMLDALATAAAPLSVSALGEAIGVDQPRASRLVQQAVERGMAQREADPEDARRTRIALTKEGRALTGRMKSQRRESLERALSEFSDHERSELARLLSKLADGWQP